MNIIKQLNVVAIIIQLVIIAALNYFWKSIGIEDSFLFGGVTYFVLSFMLRSLIPGAHRLGITFIKHKEFAAAIECFESSYNYFVSHSWIDQFRAVTMLTASKMSYREMALLNIAYCNEQLEEFDEAKKCYEKIREEFPHNERAIEMMDSKSDDERSSLLAESGIANSSY